MKTISLFTKLVRETEMRIEFFLYGFWVTFQEPSDVYRPDSRFNLDLDGFEHYMHAFLRHCITTLSMISNRAYLGVCVCVCT